MTFADRMERLKAPIRHYFEGLNDRERLMLGLLGMVSVVVFVLLPMWLVLDKIATRDEENRELRAVLAQIDQESETLLRKKSELDAMRELFNHEVPSLGGFLEQRAGELQLREVTDHPDQEVSGFTRRRVNAQYPAADFTDMMEMLAGIESSPFPVAISRIEADRMGGGDNGVKYNFRIGVDAYVQPEATPAAQRGATRRATGSGR